MAALRGEAPLPDDPGPIDGVDEPPPPDLADVRGQPVARRALEIAAAGGHHLLMVGPPGSGKTMLAQRLVRAAAAARPRRRAGGDDGPLGGRAWPCRAAGSSPARRSAPRTTRRSTVALVGGGSATLRPGEISLSHGGVLFLDELGEFAPAALDGLREPLEEGVIRVSRAHARAVLPARFQLVAATNPCPCGGGPPGWCECDDVARLRYLRRLSGPLLDRFDLRVAVQRPSSTSMLQPGGGEDTADGRGRVARGPRDRPRARPAASTPGSTASCSTTHAPAHRPRRWPCCAREMERGRLTGRGYHRDPPRRPHDRRSARGARTGHVAEQLDVEPVEVALSMRTRLRAASVGVVA